MRKKHSLATAPGVISIAIACAMLTTTLRAADTAGNRPACEKTENDSEKQKCTDDQKRAQLKSVKLRPEIRKENIQKESPLNPSALYPFIVGAGRIQ